MNTIKPVLISIISTTLLLSANAFADKNKHEAGEKVFKSVCSACHGMAGGMDMSKRIAPPMAGVRKHYLDVYPDEASFVQAITSWLEKQDEAKSLMPGAIQNFKLMPPLAISKDDAASVAAYLYAGDIEKPEGLDKHMNEMHQKMGANEAQHDMSKMAQHSTGQHKMGQHKMGQHKMASHNMGQHRMAPQNMGQGKQMRRGKMMQQMRNSMRGRRGMNTLMMQQLKLSPEQKQKMQQLIQQKQATMRPLRNQLQQINQSVRQLDTTSADYKQKVFAYADQKAKLVYRMAIEKGENRMKIESVLSPEQRAKFTQIRQNHKQHN